MKTMRKKKLLFCGLLLLLASCLLICCTPQVPDDPGLPEGEQPALPVEPEEPVTIGEGAVLVKTQYTTDDVVVADVVATEAPYLADPTGKTDATAAIQDALYAVEKLGGGVVFLPAGEYLVSHTVYIPAGVVLQGDWQDPLSTEQPEYGTVILARPEALTEKQLDNRAANPLFCIEDRCGMIGLTFYYPEQSPVEPIPYGYTIYGEAPRVAVLRDITMINSYRGVGVGALMTSTHELMQNESLRICALDTAMEMYRSSEVGYTVDLRVSPDFWIEAGGAYACSDAAALRAYCKENTLGLVFNDLDDEDFSSLYFEGCRTALYLPSTPDVPQGFWGLIYDLEIVDCMYGIVAEELCPSIGTVIAKATIDADKKAVVNSSYGGTMKLCGLTLTGEGDVCAEGGRIMWDRESDISDMEIRYGSYRKPVSYLYNAQIRQFSGETEDAAPAIQECLDAAAQTGGVVYIPAGVYSIYSTLRVPANVQLRGPTPVFVRDASSGTPNGTVLLSYVAEGACVELAANAGVNGLRIFCPLYDVYTALEMLQSGDAAVEKNVGIKGTGAGVYTYNVGVTSTFIGIDFSDCDNHLIKQTFGCTYKTFAIVGGSGGVMESCLCNPHFVNRQNFVELGYCNNQLLNRPRWKKSCCQNEASVGGGEGFAILRDSLLREYCTMIEVRGAVGQAINNVFMYAPHTLISLSDSSATLINTSADFVGMGSVYHVTDQSEVVIVNALRSAGDSIRCDETVTVDMYNRINTEIYHEGNFHTSRGSVDDFDYTVTDMLELGDEKTAASEPGASVNTDPTYIKEGSYSHCHTPQSKEQTEVVYWREFAPIDISDYMNEQGYLHLWVWVEDMGTQLWGGAIEVSSSATPDQQEKYWVVTSCITHHGWNELWLPLGSAKTTGNFNPKSVSSIRIHTLSNVTLGQSVMYFDDVYFCTAESERVQYVMEQTPVTERTEPTVPRENAAPELDDSYDFLYVSECEKLANLGNSVPLVLNRDEEYIQQGFASFLSQAGKRNNGNEIFLFLFGKNDALDISDYMEHGYLHFWIYVEDVETFVLGELELTSGRECDREEIKWSPIPYITQQGWNEVWLPLKDAVSGSSDPFDPTELNFIRLWMMTADGTYGNYYIDDIYFCMGVADEPSDGAGDVNEAGDLILATCDEQGEVTVSGVRQNNNMEMVREGSGSWWIRDAAPDLFVLTYQTPLDASAYADGYLHLWIWVEDARDIKNGQIEICSGGKCDVEELHWEASAYITQSGWNELYLPLQSAGSSGGAFRAEALNYMRIYIFTRDGNPAEYYVDDLRLTNQAK